MATDLLDARIDLRRIACDLAEGRLPSDIVHRSRRPWRSTSAYGGPVPTSRSTLPVGQIVTI
jgi:hypothetical protein